MTRLLLLSFLVCGFRDVIAAEPDSRVRPSPQSPELTTAQIERIGKRIWQNESAGSVEGLTSWNSDENFASLGIGHFIWYPAGQKGPFEESFPMLLSWYRERGVDLPEWLEKAEHCPWNSRSEFLKDRNSQKQKELRALLSKTVVEQTKFIIHRLDNATPRLLAAAERSSARVALNISLLRQSAAGSFAMIDYVNFKGDGLNPSEQYKGQGWGLLQVLIAMDAKDAASAPRAFATAAKQVLTQRVKNSPSQRNEKQWLPGWLNRCESYAQ